jgi:hypothetical protein
VRLLVSFVFPLMAAAIAGSGNPPADSHAQPRVVESRVVESIVPWLAFNSSCSSVVEVQNLGSREVAAEVEAHKSSGALTPLAGKSGIEVRLAPGERGEYKLQLSEETSGAWVRVREHIPSPQLTAVLAVSGATECLAGNELHSTVRDVAWPARNPWYSGDVKDDDDGILAMINTSERPALVRACYSFGVLYSVPDANRPAADLTPVCSDTVQEMVPPFGTRQFPVLRGGNSRFLLTTRGEAIVLQMLRPAGTTVKIYKVDATIKFGEEVQ